jgi:hypothetical protein
MLQKAQRINKINRELGKLEAMVTGDDTADWIAQLQNQTALKEAQVELALENAATLHPDPPQKTDRLAHLTALERMKLEMGLVTEEELGLGTTTEISLFPTEKTLDVGPLELHSPEAKQLGGIALPHPPAEPSAEPAAEIEHPPLAEPPAHKLLNFDPDSPAPPPTEPNP